MITKKNIRMDRRAREFIDSLLSDKKKPTEKSKTLIGNIGGVTNHSVHGWVVNTEHPEQPVDICIFSGDRLVGHGLADIYREDLKHAGFGDGCHGFRIDLDQRSFGRLKAPISIRESNSGLCVDSNSFDISAVADYTSEFVGVTDRRIVAQITSTSESLGEPGVEILTDQNQRLPCTITSLCGNTAIVEAVLDESCFDGMPHSYELTVSNANCLGAVHIEVLHSIVTPDSILKDSIGGAGYPFASKIALQRYQSLARRMEQCIADDQETLSNLLLAHRALESGPQKKASYPVLRLPEVAEPLVTVVIVAKDSFSQTYHCIASIIGSYNQVQCEVILVDDASTDETSCVEEIVENLRVVRNTETRGNTQSYNDASDVANGRYLCLLSNETEVTSGWIDNAIEVFKTYKNVGCVGGKLIYSNSKLCEAGGLVWKDGEYCRYGENENASHPRYNYIRQADYLSSTAMILDRGVFKEVGGFTVDNQMAVYEDIDLAFKVRKAGYKTIYSPATTVVQITGLSGETHTDSESGRSDQDISNGQGFREKWFREFRDNAIAGDHPEYEADRGCSFRVLVIDANTPKLNNDAGSYAAIQEMKLLIELGAKLVFLPLNFAHMGKHTERLQTLGIECLHYPFYTSVEQVMAQRGGEFDVVYITRYETVHAVIEPVRNHSSARVMFNNADLHFMRELREELQAKGCELSGPLSTREKELKAIKTVDVTLCYTETERAIVASHLFAEDNIKRCPWVVKPIANVPPIDKRCGIAFLGGFNHKPNVEAVKYFCEEIMPALVERDPEIVLKVYGSGLPDELLKLSSRNIVLVGFIEDLQDIFSTARVFVSPLLTGAGLNGKMIDCMAHGLPSVISPLTADGTGLVHGQSAIIAESVDDWVEGICELNSNDALWQQFSRNSLNIARTLFSSEAGLKRMSEILSSIGIYTDASGEKIFK